MSTTLSNGHVPSPRYIDLEFDKERPDESAISLVYSVESQWRDTPGEIKITRFTDGITNILLKITKHVPGQSQAEVDEASVLLRAYGNNTDLIIDRNREERSHALCAQQGLAPPLLARFRNGLLYRYIQGQVCTPQDLISEPVWRAVARRLGQWHAVLPISAVVEEKVKLNGTNGHNLNGDMASGSALASRNPVPNIWTVIQKWVNALPCESAKQEARKQLLQKELDRSFEDLDNDRGPGVSGFVFGHCDMLSANVIMLPKDRVGNAEGDPLKVSFIDYEYATPCAAAFDIANHFAEWGGYDCDYNMLPTKSTRRQFLKVYLDYFNAHSDKPLPENMLDLLYDEVDRYRGMPGFYWGVWALIQATISQIDFDYASYAEVRLGEYFAWRAEESGSRTKENLQQPLRERRWAEA
ncbi:hypothetical protein H2200_007780 [Cladophialophora chaetospira]|uniref:ethanolamine kinase n=1 Tax=Cladophialophora chaetospira TaxID=386627 RepID=A0AA38X6E4_9EURO|nr:hypothetical protein H2200_007780 [Cladophialophora chaetospira]